VASAGIAKNIESIGAGEIKRLAASAWLAANGEIAESWRNRESGVAWLAIEMSGNGGYYQWR